VGDDLHPLEELVQVASDYLLKWNKRTITANWDKALKHLAWSLDASKGIFASDWVMEPHSD
jgi:hypothetical protein